MTFAHKLGLQQLGEGLAPAEAMKLATLLSFILEVSVQNLYVSVQGILCPS